MACSCGCMEEAPCCIPQEAPCSCGCMEEAPPCCIEEEKEESPCKSIAYRSYRLCAYQTADKEGSLQVGVSWGGEMFRRQALPTAESLPWTPHRPQPMATSRWSLQKKHKASVEVAWGRAMLPW